MKMFGKFAIIASLTALLAGCFPLNSLNPIPPAKFKVLLARAEAGDADAQMEAAEMLACPGAHCAFGPWRPKCDDEASARWMHLAAENGNPRAQFSLGAVHDSSTLTDFRAERKNDEEAIAWYSKAAAQGYLPAYLGLARIYEEGKTVPRDEKQAAYWYEKAAEQGDGRAQSILAHMYAQGQGVAQNGAKAIEWGLKAKNKMYLFELGGVYTEINPPNYEEAYYWTSLARPALANTMLSPSFYNRWPAAELEKHLTPKTIAAVKLRVANEIARICETKDIDYQSFCPKDKKR